MEVPILKSLYMYKFFLLLFALAHTNCQDSSSTDDDTDSPQEGSPVETEITPEGGDLSIVDENNNTINIRFPEDAVYTPTSVTLSLLSDRDDFSIETPHAVAFEITPHDLLLYRPVSIMINYAQPVAEVEKALIFRENSDQLLVPLADHEYFKNQNGEGHSTRAFTNTAGVFAEGTLSPEQVESHLNALLNLLDIKLARPGTVSIYDTCNTEINKVIWDAWKAHGNGVEELTRLVLVMQLGIEIPNEGSICDNFLENFAQTVLEKCKPEDICDYNYQYIMNDALSEMQKCQNFGDDLYDTFYSRWADIRNTCIKDGNLNFQLSGNVVMESSGGPETPTRLNMSFRSEGITVPLKITTTHASGFAEIDEDDGILGGVPLYPLSGSGIIVNYPGTTYEKICSISANGFLRVEIAGSKDSEDKYSISIVTHHYLDKRVICPGEQEHFYPLGHERSRIFDIELNAQNHYMGTVEAVNDSSWSVDVALKLP